VQLPDKATLAEADTLLSALKAALPAVLATGGGTLRIDASALQQFDTSLVALLLHARRAVEAAGGRIEIVGAPPKLADLARLYGVESLLPLSAPASPAA
jgi:phospholipid transport system transporter-binding protein